MIKKWKFCVLFQKFDLLPVFHGYRDFTIGLGLESRARARAWKFRFPGSGSGPDYRARVSGSGFEIQILGLGLGPDFSGSDIGLGLRNLDSRARARVFRTQSFYFLFFWNKSLDVPGCISCWKKIFLETLVLIRLRSSLEKYTKKLSDNFLLPHW